MSLITKPFYDLLKVSIFLETARRCVSVYCLNTRFTIVMLKLFKSKSQNDLVSLLIHKTSSALDSQSNNLYL